jgi:repressor LexA
MSIATNIRRIRSMSGLTQEEFGKVVGVSGMAVSQWENGRAVPRMGAVQRIADYFHVSTGEIIDDTRLAVSSSGHATVPLVTLGRVHAGPISEEEEVEEAVEVPKPVLDGHPHAWALVVEGDCMDRVVPEGCHVLVDPDVEPSQGSIVVVEMDDHQAVLRRWYRGSTKLMLVADSHQEYEDIVREESDGPVRVLGTVVWFQAAEEME